MEGGSTRGSLLINGKECGTVDLGGKMMAMGGISVGRFGKVAVDDKLREKKYYPYSNFIDRVEMISKPPNDQDKALDLEREAKIE